MNVDTSSLKNSRGCGRWRKLLMPLRIWLLKPIRSFPRGHTPPERPYASPVAWSVTVAGKSFVAKFRRGLLSSDGGVLALRECRETACVLPIGSPLHHGPAVPIRSLTSGRDHSAFPPADDRGRLIRSYAGFWVTRGSGGAG